MSGAWWVKQKDLDDDQKNVLTLSVHQDHLIKGPPGSGKTNLLLLRAKQLIGSQQPNLVVVVHTRALQEFIRSGAEGYSIPKDKVVTFRKLAQDLLYGIGSPITLPADFEEGRRLLISALNAQLDAGRLRHEFSCVLVDEAQDFLPGEMEILRAVGKRFFSVADSRQKIYAGEDSIAVLEGQDSINTVSLPFHYRNGHKICTVADAIAKPPLDPTLIATSRYDENRIPSSVQAAPCQSLTDQVEELISRLVTQLKAYPGDMLGVFCPRGNDVEEVLSHLRASSLADRIISQRFDDGYTEFRPGKDICVSALHSAKGLEFRAVHILATEGLKKIKMNRNLAFMGVTRAKTSLTIYHTDTLHGYLEEALAKLNPATGLVGLESLLAGDESEDNE